MTVENVSTTNARQVSKLPIDPRFLDRMDHRSWAEQSPGFLQAYGGRAGYQRLAKLPMKERMAYTAITDGSTTEEEIAVATGLDSKDVKSALTSLEKLGWVATEESALEPSK